MAEQDHSEVNREETVVDLGDTDGLADERLAEEDAVAGPFDFAVLAHPADLVIGRIVGLVQPAAIRP